MYSLQQLQFLTISLIFCETLVKSEPDWTFDLISVNVVNHTPNITIFDLYVSRISRGIFALSGTIDLKEDITDEFLMTSTISYSLTGGYDFVKSPFHIPECNITTLLNEYYKDILMESFSKCSKDAPITEDSFVAPLTKRKIVFENCFISNENMPSKVRQGYYKILFEYRKQSRGSVEVLIKVEQK